MTEPVVQGVYAISCSLLEWLGVTIWVRQVVAVVDRAVPLQGLAWSSS